MNRSDYRGGDNHTDSESSAPQTIETPLNSDSSPGSSTGYTPEDRLHRFKQILPRSALYLLHEEQFLRQASESTMRVKQSNRLPQEHDPQVARRAVQKVVQRNQTRTTTAPRKPSLKFATAIQDLAVQKPRDEGEEEPSWFVAETSKLTPALFQKHIEALGLSGANVTCPGSHQRANRPGGRYCAWSRHHVHAGATLPLHMYFRSVADYFNVSPFQITPNGIQALSALYILYFLNGWDEPTPHEVHYLFDLRTNPSHNNSGFFHFYHRHRGITYLNGISHKSNAGKYHKEYFLTLDIEANNLAFTRSGPFERPLPTEEMFRRAKKLANMSLKEKDVKRLVTLDLLQMVGLVPCDQDLAVDSTTGENDTPDRSTGGLELVTSRPSPGPSPLSHRSGDLVIREPDPQRRSTIPAQPGKGKAIQVEGELSSSSDDEDEFLEQIFNADSDMFREVASKRKTGDGSGSMPPQKIQKVVPPSQGRQPGGPTTLPPLTPSSLPPSASLTPTHQGSSSEIFRAVSDLGKGLLEDIGRDASTLQSLDSYPRLSVEVVLKRGLTQLMKSLVTIGHAQLRAVDYKELIKVQDDQLVEARSKLEQAERTIAERDESLKKQAQNNASLTTQLEKQSLDIKELVRDNERLISENEELKQEKELDLIRFEEASFDCFYRVWKLNKPLNLDCFSKEAQAEDLARCEARAAEEAANPPAFTPACSALSFRARGAADVEEGVDQPSRGARL
ncbi:uncharacterized protein LOC133828836 [Humulus lupulus]|uniref:uncharacterized protein LOC133828836 n=1 Tax=Humulus lupulus TaxID=3486 RepID=UPI002B408C92|nr:uncharacterized protein LOC133828836 [Humulus lupulus]